METNNLSLPGHVVLALSFFKTFKNRWWFMILFSEGSVEIADILETEDF